MLRFKAFFCGRHFKDLRERPLISNRIAFGGAKNETTANLLGFSSRRDCLKDVSLTKILQVKKEPGGHSPKPLIQVQKPPSYNNTDLYLTLKLDFKLIMDTGHSSGNVCGGEGGSSFISAVL